MKYVSTKKIKKILVLTAVLFFAFLALHIFFNERKSHPKESEELVVTEPAPHDILFLSKEGATYSNGGNLNVKLNGEDYIVLPDGSVWKQHADGSLEHINAIDVINSVLTRALSASDPLYTNTEAITRNIELRDLTEEDIKSIANTLGISENALRNIVEMAKNGSTSSTTLSDALEVLDLRTLSDNEIRSLAGKLGVPEFELKNRIESARKNGKSLSLDDALKNITESTMKRWISSGLEAEPVNGVSADDVIKRMEEVGISAEEAFGIVAREGFSGLFEKLGFREDKNNDNHSEASQRRSDGGSNPFENGGSEAYTTRHLSPSASTTDEMLSEDLKLLSALNGIGGFTGSPDGAVSDSGVYGRISSGDGRSNSTNIQNSVDTRGNSASAQQGGQGGPFSGGGSLAEVNTQVSGGAAAYRAQNAQAEKRSFLTSFQNGNRVSRVEKESMKNMITTGTPIKAVLYTGINTDLPGMISAIVSENVYDSFTKTNILIPKFSKLIATYDSALSWGQSRIMIAWTELIRPDGVIVNLNGFQGVDSMGHAGIEGDVNHHIPSLIASTAMASLVSVSTGQFSNVSDNVYLSALFGGGANGVNNAVNNILNSAMNRQNTITVEPGEKIIIMVNSNIELTAYEE